MGDTLYNKQSHSNGPRVGLYDIPGTSTDTQGGNFFGGPYAEKVHLVPDDGNGNSLVLIEGWDPANLVARKIKVDTAGAVYIANPGGGGTGGGGGEVTSGTAGNFLATVFQGTASNLNATVVGTVTALPNGTQAVSGTVTSVLSGTASVIQVTSPWVVGGTTTTVPSGTQNVKVIGDVTSGTASNFLVTTTPTGTQAVSGAVTVSGTTTIVPSGTQAVSQTGSPWGVSGTVTAQGTVAVTQVTSPWVVSGTIVPNGTVTITPSGTQTVVGTVAATQSTSPWVVSQGTATNLQVLGFLGQTAGTSIAITSSSANNTAQTLTVTNYASVGVTFNPTAGVTGGGCFFEASDDSGTTWYNITGVQNNSYLSTNSFTLSTVASSWDFDTGNFTTFRVRINPALTGTGTGTFRLTATVASIEPSVVVGQPTAANLNATVVGTVTVTPSGTQTVTGTVAATQSTSPWVVSQGTATNLKTLANIGSTFNTGQVTVGTATGTTILASNAARIKIVLINNGTNVAYIGTATTVASTSGQYLAGIAGYPISIRSTSAVCGIGVGGSAVISYLEEVP